MTPQKFDVVIVSAFGRGEWLASEVKKKGLQVQLIDLSDSLGRWTPEDAEGPFGLLRSEQLIPTQLARLDVEGASESVHEGFVLWLKSGPFDLRGTHSNYLLEKREIPVEVSEYVRTYGLLNEKSKAEAIKSIKKLPFYLNWFAHFAHSLASPIHKENNDYLHSGRPLSIFSPLSVRRVTRRGRDNLQQWLYSMGIKIFDKAKIVDVTIDRNQITQFEIESEWSGALRADKVIWQLSSAETARVSQKLLDLLYKGEVLRPDWIWHRYRLDIQNTEIMNKLPLKFVMIDDLALPWTHSNLLFVQKTSSLETLDVWCKTPESHRFQKSYHEQVATQIVDFINGRMPNVKAQVTEYPQEYSYDEEILGPARHVVYADDKLRKFKGQKIENIYYDNPEVWRAIDWNGVFQRQSFIVAAIENWKLAMDKKIEKELEKQRRKKQSE